MSRWTSFRASLSRQSRGRSKDTIAIILLVAAGIVMTLWIFTQQKASLPSWVPIVGEEFDHITGDFTTAQAVTPGQGQAVDIASVQIGKVTSVDLEDGHAVVGMDIEPKYMELIRPNASLLLRPKTNLNDMVVEIDPGSGKGHIEDGYNFPLARTEPNQNLDAFLTRSQRVLSRIDALQEMRAFFLERLKLFVGNWYPRVRCRLEISILPGDLFIENLQLVGCPRVLKDHHFLAPDHHQALFLVRVQPTDENVRSRSPLEQQIRNRHIGDIGLEIGASHRADFQRHLPRKHKNQ